jgi:hypothetical protein
VRCSKLALFLCPYANTAQSVVRLHVPLFDFLCSITKPHILSPPLLLPQWQSYKTQF